MSHLRAEILVNGKKQTYKREGFYCRDELIPYISGHLTRTKGDLKAVGNLRFELLGGSRYGPGVMKPYSRMIDWDDIMGINADFSPISSPFLLRFYIGRVRNGYIYRKLENALRMASDEGVRLEEDMRVAWNLGGNNFSRGMGLSHIGVNNNTRHWDYGNVDYQRVFPAYKFIK